jgi:hypothetical protein
MARTIGVLGIAVLAACASTPVIKTPEQAIELGMKACDDAFGKWRQDDFLSRPYDPDLWSAKLAGDFWTVSYGPNDAGMGVTIKVHRDGQSPDPKLDCEFIATTHDR